MREYNVYSENKNGQLRRHDNMTYNWKSKSCKKTTAKTDEQNMSKLEKVAVSTTLPLEDARTAGRTWL